MGTGGTNKGETVAVDNYGIVDSIDGLSWPSGKFIKDIIDSELSKFGDTNDIDDGGDDNDEGGNGRRGSREHDVAIGRSETYWQTSARYALLAKYNLLREELTL